MREGCYTDFTGGVAKVVSMGVTRASTLLQESTVRTFNGSLIGAKPDFVVNLVRFQNSLETYV